MVDAGILLSSTLQRSVSILILLSLPELLHLMKTAISFATAWISHFILEVRCKTPGFFKTNQSTSLENGATGSFCPEHVLDNVLLNKVTKTKIYLISDCLLYRTFWVAVHTHCVGWSECGTFGPAKTPWRQIYLVGWDVEHFPLKCLLKVNLKNSIFKCPRFCSFLPFWYISQRTMYMYE